MQSWQSCPPKIDSNLLLILDSLVSVMLFELQLNSPQQVHCWQFSFFNLNSFVLRSSGRLSDIMVTSVNVNPHVRPVTVYFSCFFLSSLQFTSPMDWITLSNCSAHCSLPIRRETCWTWCTDTYYVYEQFWCMQPFSVYLPLLPQTIEFPWLPLLTVPTQYLSSSIV